MDTEKLFPLEYQGKMIACKSADDRKLLQSAILLDGHRSDCDQYPSAELQQMSKVCEQYELTSLAKLTAELAKRCDESERP
ncbi:hypothetical protein [Lacipirellula parvula]|uniref:Uncharacterized protein n=1 Tax=Lacipirellula parvula TaxID=2650471 RepID=A0A5K7X5C9_9BACT|nr:hypothetical protein [Lacipirellula parvula]BBO31595.1 hypothetical protein PLANPX_1207 [Lacipirellula parvula]